MQYWKNDTCLFLDKNGRYWIFLSISYVKVLMVDRNRGYIPAISTLIAFESAGRLGNFSRAAEELQTSQSAISRHIARLEEHLSTRVFERSRTGVYLTEAGSHLYDAVAAGLEMINRAIVEAGEASDEEHVVIACTHDVWQLVFLPRLDALQKALGENSLVRVLLDRQDPRDLPLDPDADVVFTWEATDVGPDVFALKEAVGPVCSPQYATANADILNGPISGWGRLTFLDFSIPDQRWASWEDWFEAAERPDPLPRFVAFDSYNDVLQAATAGTGIALGWRFFIERYIEAGALVPLGGGPVEFDKFYHGLLTEKGRRKPIARNCLALIGQSIQR